MRCDQCGENEAVIHLTQIVDNEMGTFHLCEACAADKGLEPEVSMDNLPLTDFLAQMSQEHTPAPTRGSTECEFCGLTLDAFKKSGRLGCSHCYVTFDEHLRALFRQLHGAAQHVGKVYLPPDPTAAERTEQVVRLRRKLEAAVQREEFERAAQIRDQIHELEEATG